MIRVELKGFVGKRCDCAFLGFKKSFMGLEYSAHAKLMEMPLNKKAYEKEEIGMAVLYWIMPPTTAPDIIRRKDGKTVVVLSEDHKYRVFTSNGTTDLLKESKSMLGKDLAAMLEKHDKYSVTGQPNVFPLFEDSDDNDE